MTPASARAPAASSRNRPPLQGLLCLDVPTETDGDAPHAGQGALGPRAGGLRVRGGGRRRSETQQVKASAGKEGAWCPRATLRWAPPGDSACPEDRRCPAASICHETRAARGGDRPRVWVLLGDSGRGDQLRSRVFGAARRTGRWMERLGEARPRSLAMPGISSSAWAQWAAVSFRPHTECKEACSFYHFQYPALISILSPFRPLVNTESPWIHWAVIRPGFLPPV